MRRTIVRTRRVSGAIAAVALFLAACGGGDDDAVDVPDAATDEPASTDVGDDPVDPVDPADEPAPDEPAEPGDEPEEPATYEPGEVAYRLVNLSAEPVDVYVRTQGLVQAFEGQLGVGPGGVTEYIAPPDGGTFLVTTAGAGDPECVGTCPHILTNLTAFPEDGPFHTVLLYETDGVVRAFDLWEDPAANTTSANAMVSADPSAGVFVAVAVALEENDFGMRVGAAGGGCAEPDNLSNVLVGGNQTPAFSYEGGSTDVLFHDAQDGDCTGEPVGGPFTVTGGPGVRTLLVLTGKRPDDVDALILPFASDPEPESTDAGAGEGASGEPSDADRDLAIALMTDELAVQLGLSTDDAACLAPYVIDAIGVEESLSGGALIDLDAADVATQDRVFEGILEGVEGCGIDPNALAG